MSIEFLDGQFAISRTFDDHPGGGERFEFGGSAATLYGPARGCPLLDGNGAQLGLIIGTPIDLVADRVATSLITPAAGPDGIMADLYDRLAGSWLCVIDNGATRRLYLDANGTKSVVFDAQRRLAAATAQILFPGQADYEERLDWPLLRALRVDADGWLPAGLTAHRGVERLMPNHYLDLDSFRTVRHWPVAPVPGTPVADDVLRAMCRRIARAIGILSADRPTHVALTAGNETRLLLACCRDLGDQVEFFTSSTSGAELDVYRAKDLAKQFGLRHRVMPVVRASVRQADAWLRRVGHSLTGANHYNHPTVWPMLGYMIGGSSGEVARGFLWMNAQPDTPLSAAGLADRLKLPRVPRLVQRLEAWLAGLPPVDTLLALDLAYIELRMGSWGYAQAYANPALEAQHVLVSRANFEAMLSLPVEMRRGDMAIRRAIELAWPELLTRPINRYGDWRDMQSRITKVMRRPGRVIAKLRQYRPAAARPS